MPEEGGVDADPVKEVEGFGVDGGSSKKEEETGRVESGSLVTEPKGVRYRSR